jgi:hypothetical protein
MDKNEFDSTKDPLRQNDEKFQAIFENSSCKKIRDDQGYWNQIEAYIKKHSDAEFSHGICPDCAHELYPDCSIDD